MAPTAAPQRLLLCPVCPFANNFATADALEMHLGMCHYPNCLPYPCITGCRGMARFPTEAALHRHSREEHGFANYEVSFQPRNKDEEHQLGRIRAHLRNALVESNPNDNDHEGDVKFLGATTVPAPATNAPMGGKNEAGGSIPATTSTSVSPRVMAPPPLEASAATSAAPNIASEVIVIGMTSGQTNVSYSSSRLDGRPRNNAAVGINAGRQGQATTAADTVLSPPSSSSAASASACASGCKVAGIGSRAPACNGPAASNSAGTGLPPLQSPSSAAASFSGTPRGGEQTRVGRVPGGPAASNNSSGALSTNAQRTQPPSIAGELAPRQLQRSLDLLAAKGSSAHARCTCGVLLNPSIRNQLGASKIQHVNSHLEIPLHECRLCSATSTDYHRGNVYTHLWKCHPHLRGATVDELERHCISHMNEKIAGKLRRGLERYFPTANRTRIDGRPGNNAGVGTSTGRRQATTVAPTELSPPSSSAASAASACDSGRTRGGGETGVRRVPSGPVASNSSGAQPSSSSAQSTQPPSIVGESARGRLQRSLALLAAKGPARCTCGVLLNPSYKNQLGASKMQHVNSHLKIPLYECSLCHSTFTNYKRGNLYSHLRRSHPHLRGAPSHELKRHLILLWNEEIAGKLRHGLERYFPTANRTQRG